MKRNTALILAFAIAFGIVGGGAVFFSVPVYAANYYQDVSLAALPVVNASSVATNGAIVATDGTSILRSGGSYTGIYSVNSGTEIFTATKSSGSELVWYYDNSAFSSAISVPIGQNTYYGGYYTVTRNFSNYTNFSLTNAPNEGTAYLYLATNIYNKSIAEYSEILSFDQSNPNDYSSLHRVMKVYKTGFNQRAWFMRVGNGIAIISTTNDVLYTNGGTYWGRSNPSQTIRNFYYWTLNDPGFATYIAAPYFDTISDAANWVDDILNNSPSPGPDTDPDPDNPNPPAISGGITFSLPPGYAADIYYGGESYTVDAKRISINKSSIFKINNRWWPYDNVLIASGVVSPLGANMDIYNSNDYNLINWNKSEPFNILRQSYIATYTSSGYDGHTIIANPVHYYGSNYAETGKVESQQTPIKITISNEGTGLTVRMWSLSDSVVDGVIHSTTIARYTKGGDGLWYDDNNNPVDPVYGGETDVESEQQATLDHFVQNIEDFFSGTWRHINQLVTSAGKLPSVVIELYSWLPDEYKAVLFSAFGITVVVAILKVML